MNHVKIGAAGLALALTALIIPAAAQAGEAPVIVEGITDRPVIYVSFADLNLAEAADVNRLNQRVRRAANRLCVQPGLQPASEEFRDNLCRAEALGDAGRQIETAVANFGKEQFAAASKRRISVALR